MGGNQSSLHSQKQAASSNQPAASSSTSTDDTQKLSPDNWLERALLLAKDNNINEFTQFLKKNDYYTINEELEGTSLIQELSARWNKAVVNFLIEHQQGNKNLAVYGAAYGGHSDLVWKLINQRGASKDEAVFGAARNNQSSLINDLISQGASKQKAVEGASWLSPSTQNDLVSFLASLNDFELRKLFASKWCETHSNVNVNAESLLNEVNDVRLNEKFIFFMQQKNYEAAAELCFQILDPHQEASLPHINQARFNLADLLLLGFITLEEEGSPLNKMPECWEAQKRALQGFELLLEVKEKSAEDYRQRFDQILSGNLTVTHPDQIPMINWISGLTLMHSAYHEWKTNPNSILVGMHQAVGMQLLEKEAKKINSAISKRGMFAPSFSSTPPASSPASSSTPSSSAPS